MTRQHLLAAWGLTTTVGWLATAALGAADRGLFGLEVHATIVALWAGLMAVPIALSAVLARGPGATAHGWVWVGLVLAGLAQNAYVVFAGGTHSGSGGGHGEGAAVGTAAGEGDGLLAGLDQDASFYHLWFALGAAGFAASALAVEGRGRKALYGVAAALNGLMVVVLVLAPSTQAAAFPIAAIIQGLPVLADLPLRDRAHRAVAPPYPVPRPS